MVVLVAGFLFSEAFWGGEPAWRDDEEERGHIVKFPEKKKQKIYFMRKNKEYISCFVSIKF